MGYFLKRNWLADVREIGYYLLVFTVDRGKQYEFSDLKTGFQRRAKHATADLDPISIQAKITKATIFAG
jgi:hypothetical protein